MKGEWRVASDSRPSMLDGLPTATTEVHVVPYQCCSTWVIRLCENTLEVSTDDQKLLRRSIFSSFILVELVRQQVDFRPILKLQLVVKNSGIAPNFPHSLVEADEFVSECEVWCFIVPKSSVIVYVVKESPGIKRHADIELLRSIKSIKELSKIMDFWRLDAVEDEDAFQVLLKGLKTLPQELWYELRTEGQSRRDVVAVTDFPE